MLSHANPRTSRGEASSALARARLGSSNTLHSSTAASAFLVANSRSASATAACVLIICSFLKRINYRDRKGRESFMEKGNKWMRGGGRKRERGQRDKATERDTHTERERERERDGAFGGHACAFCCFVSLSFRLCSHRCHFHSLSFLLSLPALSFFPSNFVAHYSHSLSFFF